MGYVKETKRLYCKNCQTNVRAERMKKTPNHILHLLLSIFTAGLWLPVWLLIILNFDTNPLRGFTCSECGSSKLIKQKNIQKFVVKKYEDGTKKLIED